MPAGPVAFFLFGIGFVHSFVGWMDNIIDSRAVQ